MKLRFKQIIDTIWRPKKNSSFPTFQIYCPNCNCVRYLKAKQLFGIMYARCRGCGTVLWKK